MLYDGVAVCNDCFQDETYARHPVINMHRWNLLPCLEDK